MQFDGKTNGECNDDLVVASGKRIGDDGHAMLLQTGLG